MIAKLSALNLVRNATSREEQVELLHVAGFTQAEIADLLGIKYATAGVILFNIRQTNSKKRSKLARKTEK